MQATDLLTRRRMYLSSDERPSRARDGAREPTGMYLRRVAIQMKGAATVAALLACIVVGFPASAQEASDVGPSDFLAAEAVVARLHEALVDAAANDATTAEERAELLTPIILETHNLPYIAQITIRRQWRTLDEAARERFVGAFERSSIMTYATRFDAVGPESFAISGSTAVRGGRIQVQAAIQREDAEDVSLDYELQGDETSWRIVNIVADGVSDLALKRSQYQKIFADGGAIDDVIDEIEGEIERL